MTTPTKELEVLKAKEQELRAKQQALSEQYHVAHGGSPDAAKRRDEIMRDLRAISDEQRLLSGRICEAKENMKKQRLADLLASPQYRADVVAAANALASMLIPWLPLVATNQAVRTAPALPTFVGTAYVEGMGWIRTMLRVGAIREGDLPKVLRSLVEEKGQ
jgi:hypothetical protein